MSEAQRPPPPPPQGFARGYLAESVFQLGGIARSAHLPVSAAMLEGAALFIRQEGAEAEPVALAFRPETPGAWLTIPAHIREGLDRHISRGEVVGSFLTAVLENDLLQAVCRADEVNRARLREILLFLHNEAPAECWGSPEKAEAWRARGGLAGRETVRG